jgi:hypothetical protein
MGYYCNFFKDYGKIATPLTTLLKKKAFTWNPVADQSFHSLKEAMCMTHFLTLPKFTKIFVLECDALGKGIGVVLMNMVGLFPSLTNKFQTDIWANQSMKKKWWLLWMLWISDILKYWGNASRLNLITRASSILWNDKCSPQSNKNG